MGKIEENIANNIVKLRKVNSMTQADLANKLQYSNKTISKWERAESMPEISVLCEISALFNVTIDFMVKEHSDKEFNKKDKEEKQELLRNILVMALWCIAAYFIATVIFIYAHLADTSYENIFGLRLLSPPLFAVSLLHFLQENIGTLSLLL